MEKQQVMQYIFLNTQKTLKEVRKRASFFCRFPEPRADAVFFLEFSSKKAAAGRNDGAQKSRSIFSHN